MLGSVLLALVLTLEPDGLEDRTRSVLDAVSACRDAGGGRIVFKPGRYCLANPSPERWMVSNHHDPMPRNVFLPLKGLRDVELFSEDAQFVCDGEGIALALVDTTNVVVRGLSFDYRRPYFSEWRLKDGRLVGDDGLFPWIVESNKLVAVGRGWAYPQRLAEFFNGQTREFLGAEWWDGSPEKKFAYPDGSVAVTRGAFRPNPTVFLYRAVNTTLENGGAYSSAGIGLMAQRSDTVAVRSWRTRNGRYFTSLQADATHFSNCRGQLSVTDSVFEGMVDDAINVHSTCLEIAAVPTANCLECSYRHPASVGFEVFAPGERLRFIRSKTLEPGAVTKVLKVEQRGPESVRLTLAGSVPGGYGIGDAVENADWQPSVRFAGNVVRNSKPRAALFTTPGKVVCESNLFDHVAGHPIELAGDARDWYESGACRDVTIRGNRFRSCAKVGGHAMILVDPQVADLTGQREHYHRNILVEGNRFEDFSVPLVAGHSISNLIVRNNVVSNGVATVDLTHSEGVCVQPQERVHGPEAWLEFMGGNVSKDGLRKDLEAIREAGLSGVQFFHIDRGEAWPDCPKQIRCMGREWNDVVSFLGDECRRLGLRLTVQNCPGWSQSGGPWIDLDHCQRHIRLARRDFSSGEAFALPAVPTEFADRDSDWRDVAVLAFPTPAGDAEDAFLKPQRVEREGTTRIFHFAEPVTVRSLVLPGLDAANPRFSYAPPWMRMALEVQTSEGWREVVRSALPTSNWRDYVETLTIACGESKGRVWRYTLEHDHPLEQFGEPRLSSAPRMTDWEGKSARTLRSLMRNSPPPQSTDAWIDATKIVDLTGRREWIVPEGRWTVIRLGSVNAKYVNAPAPQEATGWECDKLDPSGIEANFNGYVGMLAAGPLKNRLSGFLVDSWECFGQTWTPKMERYFREANGYLLRPWLPALFGWIVGSPNRTEAFLADWRLTNGALITKNYYGRMSELAREKGLSVHYETAFGDIIHGDLLEYWKFADAPMCEFWFPHAAHEEGFVGTYAFKSIMPCVSAAHIYGKSRVVAEAFTEWGISWKEDLRSLRDVANRHLAKGVTHLALQSYTHAPQPQALPPGGCMGGYNGTPFTRLQTWWKHMPEFTGWLRECEEKLEAGLPVSDVLWYLGDAVDHKPDDYFAFPEGFRADYLNFDVLVNRLEVANGLFAIPNGTTWRILWVPDTLFLRSATKAKLSRLATAGGRIVYGGKEELEKALVGIERDVVTQPALGNEPSEDFMWIHRKDKSVDRYFVAAGTNGFCGKVTFRAKGPVSVYDPVSRLRSSWTNGGSLTLARSQSVFVEFGIAADLSSDNPMSKTNLPVAGPWTLSFAPGWDAPEMVRLDGLVPWSKIAGFSPAARAYSGTVAYETAFESASDSATLDLGRVEDIAVVYVNGHKVRTLWCDPYVCDVTGFVRKGRNDLRVEVTGTWHNRVFFDQTRPEHERKTWTIYHRPPERNILSKLIPQGLLGPVAINECSRGLSPKRNGLGTDHPWGVR